MNYVHPQQKGRIAWNKGQKATKPVWNKGLKGKYPYPSPNKGQKSKFKNISRSQKVKDTIALSLRKLDWHGYGYYEKYKKRKDFLYLIVIKFDTKNQLYKIGRTFFPLKKRYGSLNYKVIKIWTSSHKKIYKIEKLVLDNFSKYQVFGLKTFLGRTQCFGLY